MVKVRPLQISSAECEWGESEVMFQSVSYPSTRGDGRHVFLAILLYIASSWTRHGDLSDLLLPGSFECLLLWVLQHYVVVWRRSLTDSVFSLVVAYWRQTKETFDVEQIRPSRKQIRCWKYSPRSTFRKRAWLKSPVPSGNRDGNAIVIYPGVASESGLESTWGAWIFKRLFFFVPNWYTIKTHDCLFISSSTGNFGSSLPQLFNFRTLLISKINKNKSSYKSSSSLSLFSPVVASGPTGIAAPLPFCRPSRQFGSRWATGSEPCSGSCCKASSLMVKSA